MSKTRGRRVKSFGGQHVTLPIKNPKELDLLFGHLLNQIEIAQADALKKTRITYYDENKKISMKEYQAERNWMLILVGVNTAFRAEDLLQLRVVDVAKGYISIKENKTGKMQNFRMNKSLHEDIKNYINKYELKSYDYLFRGQKTVVNGNNYILPINRQQGYRIVSNAAKAIGIPYVFGLHSLRKTFGYNYYKNGGDLLTLMRMFNHDDPTITLIYICWATDDAEQARTATYLGGTHKRKGARK